MPISNSIEATQSYDFFSNSVLCIFCLFVKLVGPFATVNVVLWQTLMGKVSMTVGRLKAGSRTSSRKNSGPGGLKKSDSSASNRSKGKHSKSASMSVMSPPPPFFVPFTFAISCSLLSSLQGMAKFQGNHT